MQVENIESIYELSPMQQGMLFHSLRSPQSGMYVEQLSCALRGPLDAPGFEQAWQQVVNRHSALRTSFYWKEMDKPLQVVQRGAQASLDVQDWRDLPRDAQRQRFGELLEDDRRRGFELTHAPLMRLILLRTGEREHRLIWSHHHLLLDGWCLSLLLGEVFAFYQAFSQGRQVSLPPARPFREYIAWLQRQDMSKAEQYWRRTLSGFTRPTPLPAAKAISSVPRDGAAQSAQQRLSEEQTAGLQSFARNNQLTLNSIAQAAWALLLGRYGGEQDVVFGAVVSGRPAELPGVETMVGLFINTLPTRVQFCGKEQALAWLRQLQQQQVEQREYEYSPLAQAQSWSDVTRGLPLFESIVVFENYPIDMTALSQTGRLDIADAHSYESVNYPLTVIIKPGAELLVEIKYDDEGFEGDAIKRVLRHYANLMQSITSNPTLSLSELSLLDEQERRQVLYDWNPQAGGASGDTIHRLFQQQAASRPDSIAVSCADLHLTYRTLDQRANQLAHSLRRGGVGQEDVVALMCERTEEAIIGMLAVLKAGGAYLPLDSASPAPRLQGMLQDASVKLVLTHHALAERITAAASEAGAQVLSLDGRRQAIGRESHDAPDDMDDVTGPDNLAYVIYTSGSTGRPKGVAVTHANLAWLFTATRRQFAFSSQDVWTLFHSFAFDFSVWEAWGALLHGGRLLLVDDSRRRSPDAFIELLEEERVTVLNQTPTAFYQLARADQQRGGGGLALRAVIFGGEALDLRRLREWVGSHGADLPELVNMYGITETTVLTSYHRLSAEEVRQRAGSAIGVALPGFRLLLLDERMRPAGVGIAGEIYVGGGGVARGYVGRADLTAERYIPDPYSSRGAARLYRSGDVGRWTEGAEVEYEGRSDGQVKIRGYRIEPGEVEAALMELEGVREAVVAPRAEADGNSRLIAYVIFHPDLALAVLDLRAALRAKLPEHMVPAAIVPVEQFPMNANGKLDRRALPDLAPIAAATDGQFAAPGNLVEEQLADIFAEVLGVERVGIDDSFFDLGGDSIRSIQVKARALRAGLDISIQQLFDSPTVRSLAQLVVKVEKEMADKRESAQADRNEEEKAMADDLARKQALLAEKQALLARLAELEATLQDENTAGENRPLTPEATPEAKATAAESDARSPVRLIPGRPDRRRAPLSFAQRRLWFIHQIDPESSAYNIPTIIRLRGDLEIAALERGLNEIIRRHDALRTTFEVVDNEPSQVIAPSLEVKLAPEPLDHLPESEREAEALRRAEEAARRPFDLARGPLLRAELLRLGHRDHVLLASMHHIVSDGWSMGVLVSEITALYVAYSQGMDCPLEPLPIQYADFAAWQREWLSGDVLEAQLSYWKRRLAGAPTLINLPADKPRPARQSFRGAAVQTLIEKPIAEALNKLSQRQGVTLFMTLLAAYQILLARYTQQGDIVVGIPIANRNRKELEGLIGFFVNSLVMRTDLSGDPTFIELLARVREVALGAYTHQDMPFEMILDTMQLERTLSHNPVFQVVFSMVNTPGETLELKGLSVGPFGGEIETEKFDLTLRIFEAETGLQVSLGYNTDIFEAGRIHRMVSHFKNLLASIAAHPESRLGALTLLDEAESQQVLYDWNPQTSIASGATIHRLFQQQAASCPDSIAISCADRRLTYRSLDRRANQLAHFLRRRGVGPEDVVALMCERAEEAIISMLAVLKAGAAYLPLDSSSPAPRLQGMLQDASVKLVLTHEALAERVVAAASDAGVQVLTLERERQAIERESHDAPDDLAAPDNLAYVIYTSGSTGRPKGVAVSHSNLARLFAATRRQFAFSSQDVWTLFHSLAFDFSVWEAWGALLHGGRLLLVDDSRRRSPDAFIELLEEERVTVLNQTPTAFYQLARVDHQRGGVRGLALRAVIFGGEALDLRRLREWVENHGADQPQLVNMYGITETTVHVSCRRLSAEDVRRKSGSVIGVALPDLRLLLLEEGMGPAGVGIAGEIYVGGEGVARGYVGRADLTAERFIPDPYSARGGARLYRSGDVGRWTEGAEVEYEGRSDGQVKVRGYRIEPGEVEAALTELEGVREAVVVVRVEADGDSRLIAYLAGSRQTPPTHDELRSLLRNRLPEHMLPSVFVFIDEIPLTPNGKVDRRALPAPGSARPNLKKSYHAPQNALEELLVGLWQEALGLDRVGTQDDFFTLGGDSIKGAVLINRLQAILGEIVHVVAIFDAPTVARLSAYLAKHYANAVAKALGKLAAPGAAGSEWVASQLGTLNETTVAEMRRMIIPLAPRRASGQAEPKNPQAIFVLAPPRSGTTLLRVMMGGHPQLFAPPELELMSFNTLVERRDAFTGKNSFWREGTIRAIMQVKDCDADRAKALMEECEDRRMTTQQFYRLLQTWIGARRLVDKTPSYALDKAILERMEADFESPLYVHLLRHPAGMIHSFDEYKLEQLFFRREHSFPRRQLAELIYLVSHQNIMEFLRQIPHERQHTIKFEDLLGDPQTAMKKLCDFLGLDLHPGMLKPYDDRSRKMADGLHAESRMLGDVKFNTYRDIDARVGDRWKDAIAEDGLGPLTQEMAAALGYPMRCTARPGVSASGADVGRDRSPLMLIQRGDQAPPLFCAHPVGGGAVQYVHLASALGAERAFYGLQGLDPDESFIDLEERAARLVKAVREVQPRGPYLLGGWSFGGLVAFEMAQQLRDQGEAIALLALLDPMPPRGAKGRALPVNSGAENLADLIRQIGEFFGRRYDGLREAIDLEERPQEVFRSLRESQILPPELDITDMVTWLRALKDKLHTSFKYKPRAYPGKITLFRPEEAFRQDCQSQGSSLGPDLTETWGRLSSEPIEVHVVPGSHHTMVVQPYVDALAAKLRACIREAVNSSFSEAVI